MSEIGNVCRRTPDELYLDYRFTCLEILRRQWKTIGSNCIGSWQKRRKLRRSGSWSQEEKAGTESEEKFTQLNSLDVRSKALAMRKIRKLKKRARATLPLEIVCLFPAIEMEQINCRKARTGFTLKGNHESGKICYDKIDSLL